MSQSEDSSNPENIEWQHAEHFNPVKYLLEVGRGDETTRETRRSDEIADLTRHPEARTFDEVFKRWEYERGMQDRYPHDAKVTFRTAKNKISPRPYDKIVRNGDSYFSAAVAMLVYGDADLWYLTRAEHLQYYISCLGNPSHPRYELYHMLNSAHKSLHHLSHLRLSDRIKIPNCWISHESVQQVTADLYGIFLIIFSSSFGTEAIADIRIRGSYNAPHRFLRYSGGNTYWPLVPSVKRPSEHRFPKITLDNTQGELGIANNLRRKDNDGLLHPWRRPFPDIPVPDRLSPVPITILGPIQTCVLETILWVNFKKTTGYGASDEPTTINQGSEIEVLLLATPESNQEQSVPTVAAHPPSMATKSGADQQEHRRHVDYFQTSLKDITQIALERGIDISSASTLPNREVRRERVASMVAAWEEEQESAGRKIQPVSEAVWRDMESYANARGLSSIPTGVQALRSFAKAKPGSSEHPLTRLGEMSHNGDGYIKRVLMGVEIEPVKSREENIGMYREWIEAHII